LVIPPKTHPSRELTFLKNEINQASNIKDRVNRQCVIDALKSGIEALKPYKSFGSSGLAIFSGWYS
jgi:peptide subunit release factor 1 (eRF1)